jgi:hypothetical protein
MSISATKLRQNLYNILDKVIDTGIPAEIERKGHILKIVPDNQKSKLERLENHDCLNCKPEEIIEIDWYKEWKGYNLV